MTPNPYFITGPALISFSGGRTSAYMLHEILKAHDGQLPPDVHVAFANTGKEREETLRFVHECATRWSVRVHWLEWRDTPEGFEEVGYNSASRNGEPFACLIEKKGYLPNRGAGYCSIELKGRVIADFLRLTFGWKNWRSVIGLRGDERLRALKAYDRNDTKKDPWIVTLPLYEAKVRKEDVWEFWSEQSFDLGLLNYQGNCDICWKKHWKKRARVIRDDPTRATWWLNAESNVSQNQTGKQFDIDVSVADLVRYVEISPELPLFNDDDVEHDAECGLACAA